MHWNLRMKIGLFKDSNSNPFHESLIWNVGFYFGHFVDRFKSIHLFNKIRKLELYIDIHKLRNIRLYGEMTKTPAKSRYIFFQTKSWNFHWQLVNWLDSQFLSNQNVSNYSREIITFFRICFLHALHVLCAKKKAEPKKLNMVKMLQFLLLLLSMQIPASYLSNLITTLKRLCMKLNRNRCWWMLWSKIPFNLSPNQIFYTLIKCYIFWFLIFFRIPKNVRTKSIANLLRSKNAAFKSIRHPFHISCSFFKQFLMAFLRLSVDFEICRDLAEQHSTIISKQKEHARYKNDILRG